MNKPFKGILRKCWVDDISGEVGRAEGNERIKTAPKQVVVDWVVRAWTYIKQQEDLIRKSFLVTGISCATDGSEDHLCHDDIPLQAACQEVDEFIQLVEGVDEIQLDFFTDDEEDAEEIN